jgi:hypothetical protein
MHEVTALSPVTNCIAATLCSVVFDAMLRLPDDLIRSVMTALCYQTPFVVKD